MGKHVLLQETTLTEWYLGTNSEQRPKAIKAVFHQGAVCILVDDARGCLGLSSAHISPLGKGVQGDDDA